MPEPKDEKQFKENLRKLSSDVAQKFVNINSELDRISKETNNEMLKTETDRLGTAISEAQTNIGKYQTGIDGKIYDNFVNKEGKKRKCLLKEFGKTQTIVVLTTKH